MIRANSYKQTKGYCGPSSLRMVLSHYGVFKSERELTKLVGASRKTGCNEKDILRAARLLGFKGYWKDKSSIAKLKQLISEDTPVIVNWFSPEADGHYSVVVGFTGNNIVLLDPHFGRRRRMTVERFLLRWFDFDVCPPRKRSEFFLRRIIVVLPLKDHRLSKRKR